jgi:ribose transport system substrate-binding protein
MRPSLRVVVLAVALVVLGCGRQGGQPAPPASPLPRLMQGKAPLPSGRKYQFALVPKLLDNPVFQLAREGAEAAAKELGCVEVLFHAPERADTAKQIQIIESLIDKKVDGIAISCNQGDALVPVIDKAIAAGIPTITFDSDAPKSKRLTYYGINSFQAGVKQAELLLEAWKAMGLKPTGKVVIQSGVAGAPNLEERIDGVKSVLSKYPGLKLLETLFCDDDTAKAVGQLKDVLRANPDLKGMILVGGWALFAEAPGPFEDIKPGKVAAIGFDALPTEWDYVRQGYVYALVAQRCWHWGYESIKILYGLVAEGKKYPSFIDAGLDIVTKSNVEEYARKWQTKQFK